MCNHMVTSEIRKSIRFVKIIIISRVSEISPKIEDIIHQIHRPLVQSLNSPFFPLHIGAEPGRAKEESRITCMRMLRTNQSKITDPNHVARVNVSRNAFFSSHSERKHFL